MPRTSPIRLDDASHRNWLRPLTAKQFEDPPADELNRQLSLALEHIGQALCVFDKEGRIIGHNRLLPKLLGLPNASLAGRTLLQLNRMAARAAGIQVRTADTRARAAMDDQMALLRSQKGGETEHVLPNGKVLRAVRKPMGDGSWVMTLEDITERKRAETMVAHLARHDGLTGLPNRNQFVEYLGVALGQVGQSGRKVALVSFDLEQFSEVNDNYGTATGDAVIVGIADRVRTASLVGELIARVGGDEFSVIKVMQSEQELEEFIPRLLRSITAPSAIGDAAISVKAKMGIAIFPSDATDSDKLMANAALALARARADYAATVCLYDPAYDEVARQRRDLARDMVAGLDQDQFFIAYQAQHSIGTGDIVGYEALLRWQHPTRGPVSPNEFIPIAEQAGLIQRLGQWVLEAACREAFAARLPGRIAVNLSPLQLGDITLAETVATVLRATGLSPNRLELEVTETAVVANKARALKTLNALKAIGVTIALDDFGTGYSSLETLRSLHWDKIKLDRSFIAELEGGEQGRAIMRAVISLGKALQTPVLAEGVENNGQLNVLRQEGCDEVQGYLFGWPVPIAELDAMGPRGPIPLVAA